VEWRPESQAALATSRDTTTNTLEQWNILAGLRMMESDTSGPHRPETTGSTVPSTAITANSNVRRRRVTAKVLDTRKTVSLTRRNSGS